MEINLAKKIVLLTGATRGIGKAITELLGSCGATIALHYNTSSETASDLADQVGNSSKPFQADLSNPSDIEGLYQKVIGHYGNVDVLVNNAGIAICSPATMETSGWLADWNRTLMVNLTAAGLLCKLTLQDMIPRQSGIIDNISSRAAHRGDAPDYLAYAASKGGMEALTKSIARGYGKFNVTAFGVAPGFTRTEMAQDFIDTYGEEYATNDLALPEMTEPIDIARTVAFLASGLAKHATGTTIDVNAASYVR